MSNILREKDQIYKKKFRRLRRPTSPRAGWIPASPKNFSWLGPRYAKIQRYVNELLNYFGLGPKSIENNIFCTVADNRNAIGIERKRSTE